jgi:hypothetical protein
MDRQTNAGTALLRRVDSFTGAALVGRKGGDFAGIAIPYFAPGSRNVREYRLRRDRPELEAERLWRGETETEVFEPAWAWQHALPDSRREQGRPHEHREAQIWYNREPDQYPLSDRFENVIVLSDEFYQEITAHPIPADLEAVKVLAGAPAALDLFMWLSFRCFVAKGQEAIPLLGSYGLASQIGSIEYARPRRFREKLEEWLKTIRVLWPDCPARISSDGKQLLIRRGQAIASSNCQETKPAWPEAAAGRL